MNAALPAALGAGLLLFLLGSKKASAQTAGTVPASSNIPIAQRMATVLATRDPNAIRFEAGRLRQEGHPTEAAQLEAAAAQLEQQIAAGHAPPPSYPSPAPSTPAPSSPVSLPSGLPPVVTVPGVGTIPLPTELPPLPPIVNPEGPNPTVTIPPVTVPGVGTTPPLTIQLPPVGAPPSSTPPIATPATPASAAGDWSKAVPAALKGATLRAQSPVVFDARTVLWQQRLAALGYPVGTVDGKFGPTTTTATKLFQQSNGLTADGIVGANTLAKAVGHPQPPKAATPAPKPAAVPAAKPAAAPAAKPAAVPPGIPSTLQGVLLKRQASPTLDPRVMLWQAQLGKLGFPAGSDGKFGPTVEAQTKAFQKSRGLTADGIVGPATLAAAYGVAVPKSTVKLQGDEEFGRDMLIAPPEPLPASPIPGLLPDMAPKPPSPDLALASRLTLMVLGTAPGREDRDLIRLFQSSQGMAPTGLYTPDVAYQLAARYGIVPPKPRVWGRTKQDRARYKAAMLEFASRDRQRAEEWRKAGDV